MAKKPAQRDWHREDIKAAIRKRFGSMSELARVRRVDVSVIRRALQVPYPKVERLIAEALGTTAPSIWPSRYSDVQLSNPRHWRRLSNTNSSPSAPGGNVNSDTRG